MIITKQDIQDAAKQLQRSERGRGAMAHVRDLLKGSGTGLDGENQKAVLTLIVGSWQGQYETATEVIDDHIGI